MAVDEMIQHAVHRIAVVFERRKVRHALIGGLAVGLRSRPRATKDADFIVDVPAVLFPGLLEELIVQGFDIDLMAAVRRWSADRLLVFSDGRVRIDWMQPILPLYNHVLQSAVAERWKDATLKVATAEGIILTKLIAFRPLDLIDIESLLTAHRDQIDLDHIRRVWATVSEDEDERTAWFEAAAARYAPRGK